MSMSLKRVAVLFPAAFSAAALLAACAAPAGTPTAPGSAFSPARPTTKRAVFAVHPETNDRGIGATAISKNAIYDSVVTYHDFKVSSNISSLGFECCTTKEFGDGLVFTRSTSTLKKVAVVMNSWGCQSGHWYSDDCATTKGSTFPVPITLNVYAVNSPPSGPPGVGQLLATQTNTFQIPYRPSKNDALCTGQNAGMFVGPIDKMCDNGFSHVIWFNFLSQGIVLPAQAIVTVTFNTSDAGYNPIGQNTPCFTSSGGCGYDSLNVSADGNGGFVGSNVDPNGVFVNFGNSGFYCSGSNSGLILDTPCWTGYHPEIAVFAQ